MDAEYEKFVRSHLVKALDLAENATWAEIVVATEWMRSEKDSLLSALEWFRTPGV
jgi:hypothetical protein